TALFLLLFASACNDDKPKTTSKPAASAEPIPTDVVYNAFMDDKAGAAKVAVATDAGAAPSGTAQTGSTAKLIDAGADPKAPLFYAYSTKTRTVTANITIAAAGGGPN